MAVNCNGKRVEIVVLWIELGLLVSTKKISALGAYSTIICRQAPQGAAPPGDATAKAEKFMYPSVSALNIAIRSAQQLSP